MGPAAPIDEAIMNSFFRRSQTHPLVETVSGDRTGGTLTVVRVVFDADQYPDRIQEATVEIRWHTNGDYNFHYTETHASEEDWQCRWDRHPNPHTTRTHFHPPPAARSRDAIPDSPSDHHPSAMFTRTVASIRGRIEDLWEAAGR